MSLARPCEMAPKGFEIVVRENPEVCSAELYAVEQRRVAQFVGNRDVILCQ